MIYLKVRKLLKNKMHTNNCDVLIIGGGIVGLCTAYQLIEQNITKRIIILDKEKELGLHSSGRNTGVLHAGLYYIPNTIKAKVCVSGSRRLKKWIEERKLPIKYCGKVIVPQKDTLDSQLDVLSNRAIANGAKIELWDELQLKSFIPEARTASGRALWSPNTVVIKPNLVMKELEKELQEKGVKIVRGCKNWKVNKVHTEIHLANGEKFSYAHLFNCAGLHSDEVAHQFGIGNNYKVIPFKGIYWKIKKDCPIQPSTNLYPVPDLNIPFLGVHFTPSADSPSIVSIGPTATPAIGRENYQSFENIEPIMTMNNVALLSRLYLGNKEGFRRYVHEQAFLMFPWLLLKSAKELIPSIELKHIEISKKVGIRAQLFNLKEQRLENDFLCHKGPNSTHVLNAISPAFTASFSLADLIIEKSELNKQSL